MALGIDTAKLRRGVRTLWGRLGATPRPVLVAGAALLVVATFGLYAVGRALEAWYAIALVALLAVAAAKDSWKAKVLEVLGATVAGIAVLLGFNVAADAVSGRLGLLDEGPPTWGIWVGLPVAVLVFGLAAWWYLRVRGHWGRRSSVAVGFGVATLFVLGLPLAIGQREPEAPEGAVATQVRSQITGSTLDVYIVAERAAAPGDPPGFVPPAAPEGLDVRYSVGFVDGAGVRWSPAGDERAAVTALATGRRASAVTAPDPRDGDRVLLLLVDGTPPVVDEPAELPDATARRGEVERWSGLARAAAIGPRTPTHALLQTRDRRRLARWSRLDAVSLQELASTTVTDAAVRLGLASARADWALAVRHRPVLLFDDREPVPRPLSIQALFDGRHVQQCRDAGRGGTACSEPVTDPGRLENGGTRLQLELPGSKELVGVAKAERKALESAGERGDADAPGAPPPGTPPAAGVAAEARPPLSPGLPASTMYVHLASREVDGRRLLYLDYWWYLPDNPARSGGGALCGAGLVIPGISCFDHESDWEGVTVVVRQKVPGRPASAELHAVHYAEHASVVRYSWKQLERHWRIPALARLVPGGGVTAERPLVFVSSGTHASYPTPCPGPLRRGACRQVANRAEENRADGRLPWLGNYASVCGTAVSCLEPLPTTRPGGSEPALWNDFDGPWGRRHCILRYYCDSTQPPTAPGRQGRYEQPARVHGSADLEYRGPAGRDTPRLRFSPGVALDE